MKTIHPWNEHKRTEPTTYEQLSSGSIVRAGRGTGKQLPRMERPDVIRGFRSKYAPHTGRKQLAKIAAKKQLAAA